MYGAGIEERLTGLHETAPWTEYSYGVSDRGASVRIPWQVEVDKKGYIEDRRPNANCDPYQTTAILIETICGAAEGGTSQLRSSAVREGALRGALVASDAVRCAAMEERSPHEVLELVDAEEVEFVDLRFCDLPGRDAARVDPGQRARRGPVRGRPRLRRLVGARLPADPGVATWSSSPDPNTAYLDPFRRRKTLVLHCYVADPVTGERYSRDPRYVAQKAQEHLFSTGVADTAYFGPEPEFFIFDDVRFETTPNGAIYQVDSVEGQWNTGTRRGPEPRLQAPHQGGLLPDAADGPLQDLRSDMAVDAARRSASRPSCTTTRWPPAARARSASASTRCWRWPTS